MNLFQKHKMPLCALFITALLIILLSQTLHHNPFSRQSALIDHPAPAFQLNSLVNHTSIDNSFMKDQITLIHFWGSWCIYCQKEYASLKAFSQSIPIVWLGIDFKDEKIQALRMIFRNANPYAEIGFDPEGKVALDFGVVGAPETFIVDREGIIRFHHQGPITTSIWQNELIPAIKALQQ